MVRTAKPSNLDFPPLGKAVATMSGLSLLTALLTARIPRLHAVHRISFGTWLVSSATLASVLGARLLLHREQKDKPSGSVESSPAVSDSTEGANESTSSSMMQPSTKAQESLYDVVAEGDQAELDELLKCKGIAVKADAKALWIAIRNGSAPIAETLIRAGASPSAPYQENGCTPLGAALVSDFKSIPDDRREAVQLELVELLCDRGADPNEPISITAAGSKQHPLELAIESGCEALFQLLLRKGAKPKEYIQLLADQHFKEWAPKRKRKALLEEIQALNDATFHVRALTKACTELYPDPKPTKVAYASEGLSLAVELGKAAEVQRFLKQETIEPNSWTFDGDDALLVSGVYGKSLPIVQALLKAGIDVNQKGADEERALHVAVSLQRGDIACALLKHGAKLLAPNSLGHTPKGMLLEAEPDFLDRFAKSIPKKALIAKRFGDREVIQALERAFDRAQKPVT